MGPIIPHHCRFETIGWTEHDPGTNCLRIWYNAESCRRLQIGLEQIHHQVSCVLVQECDKESTPMQNAAHWKWTCDIAVNNVKWSCRDRLAPFDVAPRGSLPLPHPSQKGIWLVTLSMPELFDLDTWIMSLWWVFSWRRCDTLTALSGIASSKSSRMSIVDLGFVIDDFRSYNLQFM